MAISFTNRGYTPQEGSRSNERIIGLRKAAGDNGDYFIMHANGNETPDGGRGKISEIVNGSGSSIIVYESGNREKVHHETGLLEGI